MAYLVWTRRQTLASFLAGASVLALGGCSESQEEAPTVSFDHGVASGDPLNDRVVIWTRATPAEDVADPIQVSWVVAWDPELQWVARSGDVTVDADSDYIAKIDVDRLAAGTTYYFGFRVGDQASPTGRTKTMPAENVDSLKIAVLSCSNYPAGFFNVYRTMAEIEDLDLAIHLGDYIYEYGADGYGSDVGNRIGRINVPAHELLTLEDYRQRYALYRTDPDLQALHAHVPMIAIWDDHETANNSWTHGAQNHSEDGSEGDWDDRKAAFTRAYHEWLPIRTPNPDNKDVIQRSFQAGSLASIMMVEGRLVGRDKQLDYAADLPYVETPFDFSDPSAPVPITDEATLNRLKPEDVRTIKTPFDVTGEVPQPILDYARIQSLDPDNLPDGIEYLPNAEKFLTEILGADARELLGQDQEQWLGQELKASTSSGVTWQVMGNPIMMARFIFPDLNDVLPKARLEALMEDSWLARRWSTFARLGLPANLDSWDGYPAARERVYQMAQDAQANLIVLTGDTHTFWASELLDGEDGKRVGVEFATTAVSSSTLGQILKMTDLDLGGAVVEANEEIKFSNFNDNGGIVLTLTPTEARADYIAVDTVESQDYKSKTLRTFVVFPNQDGAVGPLTRV